MCSLNPPRGDGLWGSWLWRRMSLSSCWDTLLRSFSTNWATPCWFCLKLEDKNTRSSPLHENILHETASALDVKRECRIPLQQQAQLILCQQGVISLSAQPLHLRAQSLQANTQPLKSVAPLTCEIQNSTHDVPHMYSAKRFLQQQQYSKIRSVYHEVDELCNVILELVQLQIKHHLCVFSIFKVSMVSLRSISLREYCMTDRDEISQNF